MSHHKPPRPTTSHHDLPRATTTYHEPPRPTTSHHDLPQATTSHHDPKMYLQEIPRPKNLFTRNTTSQKLRYIKIVIKHLILKTVLKHLIFCVAYYKIEQVIGVGLVVRVVGWSSLTSLFI